MSNKNILDLIKINFNSKFINRIFYWNKIENFLGFVPNKLCTISFFKIFSYEKRKLEIISKSDRPLFPFIDIFDYVGFTGIQGENSFPNNTQINENNNETTNINKDWYNPHYISGLQMPLSLDEITSNNEIFKIFDKEIQCVTLPSKNSYIHLDNYVWIKKSILENFTNTFSSKMKISNQLDETNTIRIEWKIHKALSYSKNSNLFTIQTIKENFDFFDFPDDNLINQKFFKEMSNLNYSTTNQVDFASSKLKDSLTSTKNQNFLNKIIYNNKDYMTMYQKELKFLTDLQLFYNINNQIEKLNLKNEKLLKWFENVVNVNWIINTSNKEIVQNETTKLIKFYFNWKDYINKNKKIIFIDKTLSTNEQKIINHFDSSFESSNNKKNQNNKEK